MSASVAVFSCAVGSAFEQSALRTAESLDPDGPAWVDGSGWTDVEGPGLTLASTDSDLTLEEPALSASDCRKRKKSRQT